MVRILLGTSILLLVGGESARRGTLEPEIPESKLSFCFRDDHDGRKIALVHAVLRGRRLEIEIETQGRGIAPPPGYAGVAGQNLQSARELERRLEEGALWIGSASGNKAKVVGVDRGSFQVRVHDPVLRRIEERATVQEWVRGIRFEAELRESEERRPFAMEFRASGRIRLILRGWYWNMGGRLLGFEQVRGDALQDLARKGMLRGSARARQETSDEDLAAWVKLLGAGSLPNREEASKKLRDAGEKALPVLMRESESSDPEVRARIHWLVREIRLDRIAALKDPGDRAKEAEKLEEFSGRDALAPAVEGGDARLVPFLTDVVMYEADADRRERASQALLAIGSAEVCPALLWWLRSPALGHSDAVADWISKNGDRSWIPALTELQREIGSAGAQNRPEIENLLRALRERFPQEEESPAEWAPIDPSLFLSQAVEGRAPEDRIRAIRAVLTGGSWKPEARRALGGALSDPDEAVRYHACEAFTFLGDVPGEQIAVLAGRLSDERESIRVRQMAALALGKNWGEDSRIVLLEASERGPVDVRSMAIRALGDTGDKSLLEVLKSKLENEKEPALREALILARNRIEKSE